ncbi:MAG TPA: FAD-dependent oxidoreductase [Chloroflexia bacterium]|nr:FAD-dependent oxidoreductase [Chloroflexia bacterium]
MALEHHKLECDVLVAGGGMSGVCAALAAAQHGARVILLQDRAVLGGNASSEVRMHIVGADMHGKRPFARESGLIEAIRLEDAYRNPARSASLFDLLLWERVKKEPNITLLLNTHLDKVQMAGPDRIASLHANRHSTEDEFTIEAAIFLDCTGDGRLGIEAGAEYVMGREARETYNELDAADVADGKVLGSSILFMAREHDRPVPFKAPPWAKKFSEEDLTYRPHVPFEYGFWWAEWGGDLDTIKDNEKIRDELWAIVLGIWDHIKNGGDHGADNWSLEWVGTIPGKRESRRFLGDYVLRQQDLEESTLFPDRVAYGGWPIDRHPASGIKQADKPPADQIVVPLYSIPLRSLYSRNITNLMMGGRLISASHVAFASTRVMATCSVIGQAIGTAAALCMQTGLTPRQLAAERIGELQQLLLKDDTYLIDVPAVDPANLANGASVSASSYLPGSEPELVLNGITRQISPQLKFGNRSEDFRDQKLFDDASLSRVATNQWASDPAEALPQYLQLSLRKKSLINEIHLTFDSGFQRELTLTQSNKQNSKIIRGPQPETIRDYSVEVCVEGQWTPVVEVVGNYQRKVVHKIEPIATGELRLIVKATNGDASARLFEIRLYGLEE